MKVEFYELDKSGKDLQFVVIQARYQDKWIFVRHKDRTTWEFPGGHIEEGEDVDIAAERELWEETGAYDCNLIPVCDYSVDRDGRKTYGRLYFAEVYQLGKLEFEIEEISFGMTLPDKLTYEQIQPFIFKRVEDFLSTLGQQNSVQTAIVKSDYIK